MTFRHLVFGFALAGCMATEPQVDLGAHQRLCTTVDFIAQPGFENDAFLQGNKGRQFIIDQSNADVIDVKMLDTRGWPEDFQFKITANRGGVISARHQAFNRFTGEPNMDLAYEITLQPDAKTGEMRSITTFRGAPMIHRYIWSCRGA